MSTLDRSRSRRRGACAGDLPAQRCGRPTVRAPDPTARITATRARGTIGTGGQRRRPAPCGPPMSTSWGVGRGMMATRSSR